MKKKAYVRIEREYGDNYYHCEACGEHISKIIGKIFKKLLLRLMQNAFGVLPNSKLVKIPRLYCPGCKKRLDFSKLGVSIQTGIKSASVKAKRISKLLKKKEKISRNSLKCLPLKLSDIHGGEKKRKSNMEIIGLTGTNRLVKGLDPKRLGHIANLPKRKKEA